MAINLVSLIMQFLTPDMIGRIASAVGVPAQNFHKAGKHWRMSRASRTVTTWLRFSAALFRSSPSVFAAAPR